MCYLNLSGVRIDNLSGEEIEKKVKNFLENKKFNQIVTVNPEFIIKAQKDSKFKNAINSADLNVADGVGIKFAFWRFQRNLKKRITGIDLMWNILRLAEERGNSIFLLTNKNGLSSWRETGIIIKKKFPLLKIKGLDTTCYNPEKEYKSKNIYNFDILFCNFGAPHQEKFIANLKNKKTNIKLAVGVGGGFDFISGKIKRAPKLFRIFGMEWLWRLILEPRYRIKKIYNAVIIFPIRILLNK